MIEYKDFYWDIKKKSETFNTAVEQMNNYLKNNNVKVINVESLSDGGGSNDISSQALSGVRLWYEKIGN